MTPSSNAIRPLYWSVRRELWENRSIYLAPLSMAAVVMFACFVGAMTAPHRMRAIVGLSAEKQHVSMNMPFTFSAGMMIITASVVAAFYCIDALYSERRDRSILFWKSLPVPDRTALIAKLSIPAVVLPAIAYSSILVIHFVTYMLYTMMLAGNGSGLALLWSHVHYAQLTVAVLYGIIALALWLAPVYAWFLLVSAWARRTPILWAVLPFFALGVFEHVAFSTSFVFGFIEYRITGWYRRSYIPKMTEPLDALDPAGFLTTPGLWLGLAFAAIFIAAAIRLRHDREPI
jgi:ABC-2 type transport system permease protein